MIQQTKLLLSITTDNNAIVGDWVQNDSIHIPLTAIQKNNSIYFNNMQLQKQFSSTKTKSKQKEVLQFLSGVFQLQKNKDSVKLVGTLQLFNVNNNEPHKPINLILTKLSTVENDNAKGHTINELNIFPNPVNNNFNISINAAQATKANISLHTQQGNIVYKAAQPLQKGKQTFSVNASLNNGVYILKVETATQTISRVILKTNQNT